MPVTVYAAARIFIFFVPRQGFMAVDPLRLPGNLQYYLEQVWLPRFYLHQSAAQFVWDRGGTFILAGLLLLGLLALWRRQRNLVLACTGSLLLLLPFALLAEHLFYDRGTWAVAFAGLLFGYFTAFCLQRHLAALPLLLALLLPVSDWGYALKRLRELPRQEVVSAAKVQLWADLKQELEGIPPQSPVIIDTTDVADQWLARRVVAGMLAAFAPERHLFITANPELNLPAVMIYGGSYYTFQDHAVKNPRFSLTPGLTVWIRDPYGVDSRLTVPPAVAGAPRVRLDTRPVFRFYRKSQSPQVE